MPKENENLSQGKDFLCHVWLKNLPLHKKVISAAGMTGLILIVIIVLALVFTAKEGN